jgi:HlyD family secretion protein
MTPLPHRSSVARVPRAAAAILLAVAPVLGAACRQPLPADHVVASGHVEATEVRVAPEVGGRVVEMKVEEGTRVAAGDTIARLDTADTELALARVRAERDQAEAQLRLLLAGSRVEDVRQAEAQVAAAASQAAAARAELASAEADLKRFEDLLQAGSGSRKQRDDAATRRQMAIDHAAAAESLVRAAREIARRLASGARREEIDAARARVATVDAQRAVLEKSIRDATVVSPAAGIVTEKLVEPGELVPPRTALVVVTDLDRAWANVYVDEPAVPRIRLGQPATVRTDAGGPGLPGSVTYISPRAEFTPRNAQTAEERSKLVYRLKVAVDNTQGVLKAGMPVEAELALQPLSPTPPR